MTRVYLDNCCFNRPYDDQNSIKIFLETEAKLYIQNLIKEKKIELAWSYILDFENDKNQDEEKMELISDWVNYSITDVDENEKVVNLSNQFIGIGVDEYDSLHLACAIFSKCNYFITTDMKILKKSDKIKQIEIKNPIDFVKLLEEKEGED